VTDFGRTPDGLVYFVMEELYGKSLAQVIRAEGSLALSRVVGIASQVCRALQAAHQVGIVHRDLKPENIVLVTREDQVDFVKVLDFGISKTLEQQPAGARLTQAGMIVGTPEYMSPEQASGNHVDVRSDVYSLGVMVFEMVTGRLPFNGENTLQILMKHQTQPPPSIAESGEWVPFPPSVEAMVHKALAKRPEDRQQTMAEWLADLHRLGEELQQGEPAPARPPSRDVGFLEATDPSRFRSQPGWASPTTVTPAAPAASLAEGEFDAAALHPSRIGRWAAVALVLFLGGLGALALNAKLQAPKPPSAPVAPQANLLPPAAPAQAALPAPPPSFEPAKPPRAGVPPKPQRARKPDVPAQEIPTPPPTKSEGDPYQKVDDLKPAY
jgi:serine/threonine-protein kinase